MLKNAPASGTFSTGTQIAGAASYALSLRLAAGVSLIIDNVVVYRQDATPQTTPPARWSRLSTLPFPRLGNKFGQRTDYVSSLALDEGAPFTYSVEQIERRLSFADVIGEVSLDNQTQNPDSIHRIRALNPNAVILPVKDFEQQRKPEAAPPSNSNIDLEAQLSQSSPSEWKATTTDGTVIFSQYYPNLYFMNVSDFVPAVNGQTWLTTLESFVTTQIFPTGLWDGIYFNSLLGVLDPQLPHSNDPAQFNYDWNRNGQRDETLAATSETLRAAIMKTLQQVNSSVSGSQLVMGNTFVPEFALAPLVNGYAFECFNLWWDSSGIIADSSPARWRSTFDGYLRMQAIELTPQINLLEGCGSTPGDYFTFTGAYLTPTQRDFQKHRFSMGTALLGNGFYEYDLKDTFSAPYWFDEYTVDASGAAVEDRLNKGYLGQPLSEAVELTNPGTLVFGEGFEGSALPTSFSFPNGGASITRTNGEVISGLGSLVLSNPDHTRLGSVNANSGIALTAAVPYLLTLDWRILESLDQHFQVSVSNGSGNLDFTRPAGFVAGDSGTVRFPFVVSSGGNWTINILLNGGGKVAIDNIQLYRGGVGPWRRDFENGFVLLNPLNQPRTFSAAELAGSLNRTGIHRIKGTQAPDVNTGEAVTGPLTLAPFDAIILLADHMDVPGCTYSLDLVGGVFPSTGGTGTFNVTTAPSCPWSILYPPSWVHFTSLDVGVGNGTVTFQVDPLAGASRSGNLTIAGKTFALEQTEPITGLTQVGSLAQVASQGTWNFTADAVNLGTANATARIAFNDNNGNPLFLPVTFPQAPQGTAAEFDATLDRTIAPDAQVILQSTGPANTAALVGSSQLLATGSVGGFGIFSNPAFSWNAVVPLETRNAGKYYLAFDNTGSLTTGIAIANLASSGANVAVVIRDDTGAQIGGGTIALAAQGHTSFMMNDTQLGYPVTNGKRGTIEFDTPQAGQISVLGLRANGPALTTLPVLASTDAPGGAIAHSTYNGGFTSTFYLVNTGTASASFTLSFYDEQGNPLSVPLLLPQTGSNQTTSALTQTLAAGAILVVQTVANDQAQSVVGSAQLSTTGSVSGFEIFKWTTFGQKASVPLETRTPGSFVLVFDNTGGLTTGVALSNIEATDANVMAKIYNDAGNLLQTASINLVGRGHTSFLLPSSYSVTENKRGKVEFVVPAGGKINAVGLRAKADGTLTTIPVLTR